MRIRNGSGIPEPFSFFDGDKMEKEREPLLPSR